MRRPRPCMHRQPQNAWYLSLLCLAMSLCLSNVLKARAWKSFTRAVFNASKWQCHGALLMLTNENENRWAKIASVTILWRCLKRNLQNYSYIKFSDALWFKYLSKIIYKTKHNLTICILNFFNWNQLIDGQSAIFEGYLHEINHSF
jgi:hypothetical protein